MQAPWSLQTPCPTYGLSVPVRVPVDSSDLLQPVAIFPLTHAVRIIILPLTAESPDEAVSNTEGHTWNSYTSAERVDAAAARAIGMPI